MRVLKFVQFAIRRLRNAPGLTIAWLLGVMIAVALIVNVPLFSEAASLRLLRVEIAQSKSHQRPLFALHLYRPWNPTAKVTGQEYYQYQLTSYQLALEAGTIALPLVDLIGRVETPPFQVSQWKERLGQYEMTQELRFRVGFMDKFDEHVEIVEGEKPVMPGDASQPIPVLVNWYEAGEIGLFVGDRVLLTEKPAEATKEAPTELEAVIVGLWRAKNEQDPYWFTNPREWTRILMMPQDIFEARVVPAVKQPVAFASWYLIYDDAFLRASQVTRLRRGIESLTVRAQQVIPQIKNDLYNPLQALESFERRYKSLQLVLIIFNAPIVAGIIYALTTISDMIVTLRKGEVAMLRSRGASHRQVMLVHLIEVTLVGIVALSPGLYLAQMLTRWMSRAVSFLAFGSQATLQPRLASEHLVLGILSLLLIILTAVIGIWRNAGYSVVSYRAEQARATDRPFWEKYGLDILLLALSLYGYWQLERSSAIRIFQQRISLGQTTYEDPLMYLVPVFFIASGAMIAMRLMPYLMALIYWVGQRSGETPLYIALNQLSRRPRLYSGPLLLIVFMISLAIYTAALARTLDTNLRDRAYYQIGADVVLAERPPQQAGASALIDQADPQEDTDNTGADGSRQAGFSGTRLTASSMWFLPFYEHLSLPGVEGATRVGRYSTNFKLVANEAPAQVLAIEPSPFAQVAFFREDFARETLEELLTRLTLNPNGVLLSERCLREAGLAIGDPLALRLDMGEAGWVNLSFVVAGRYDYFPTVFPDQRVVFVANIEYIADQLGGIPFYDAWMRTAPDTDVEELSWEVITQFGLDVPTAANARQVIAAHENLPERLGFFGSLSAGFLGVGGLAVVGYALFVFLMLKRRSVELGVLRAIGFSKPSVARSLVYEQVLMLLMAIAGAVGWGLFAAHRFIPLVEVGQTRREQVPPYLVHMAWGDLVWMVLIIGIIFLLALGAIGWMLSRQRIFEAIKLSEHP